MRDLLAFGRKLLILKKRGWLSIEAQCYSRVLLLSAVYTKSILNSLRKGLGGTGKKTARYRNLSIGGH